MHYDYKHPKLLEALIGPRGELYICGKGAASTLIPPSHDEPKTVYHYTSVKAFKSILSNQSIRLTDLFTTNDYKEVIWFFEQFDSYLKSLKELSPREQEKIIVVREVFRQNLLNAFAASFSDQADDLSQWRGYGDNGAGIALGICPQTFNITRDLPERRAEGENQPYSLAFIKVSYDEEEQRIFIQEILNDVLREKLDILTAGSSLAKIAYTCKQNVWNSEHEWRILYTPLIVPYNTVREDSLVSQIKEYYTTPVPRKYGLFKLLNNSFSEIILGPKCKLTQNNIQQLLANNNIQNYRIKTSIITLR